MISIIAGKQSFNRNARQKFGVTSASVINASHTTMHAHELVSSVLSHFELMDSPSCVSPPNFLCPQHCQESPALCKWFNFAPQSSIDQVEVIEMDAKKIYGDEGEPAYMLRSCLLALQENIGQLTTRPESAFNTALFALLMLDAIKHFYYKFLYVSSSSPRLQIRMAIRNFIRQCFSKLDGQKDTDCNLNLNLERSSIKVLCGTELAKVCNIFTHTHTNSWQAMSHIIKDTLDALHEFIENTYIENDRFEDEWLESVIKIIIVLKQTHKNISDTPCLDDVRWMWIGGKALLDVTVGQEQFVTYNLPLHHSVSADSITGKLFCIIMDKKFASAYHRTKKDIRAQHQLQS